MKILTGPEQGKLHLPYPVLTIGNFDGVHRGHQVLIRTVVDRARTEQGIAAVMTFEPHPLVVLAPLQAPPRIQTLAQRLNSLEELGVDLTWVIPFSEEISRMSGEEFVRDMLCRQMGIREICVGRHFVFGRGRQGNMDLLRSLGPEMGFTVREVEELRMRGFRISSTRIRELLADGRVALAGRILGRPPQLRGQVTEGARMGRQIGFPTANLSVENELIPKNGVYITTTVWNGVSYPSLTNIGFRPTVASVPSGNGDSPIVETHLLDFSKDIYGQTLDIQFHFRLRDEVGFPSPELLAEQITLDRGRAVRYFSRAGRPEFKR